MPRVRAQLGIYQNFGRTLYPCVTVPRVGKNDQENSDSWPISFVNKGSTYTLHQMFELVLSLENQRHGSREPKFPTSTTSKQSPGSWICGRGLDIESIEKL
jgi:hypothetical protein